MAYAALELIHRKFEIRYESSPFRVFDKLSKEEKLRIVRQGPPTPSSPKQQKNFYRPLKISLSLRASGPEELREMSKRQ